ncbi:hypothetical protein MRB53_017555 [Persea americana]|uniref:Uncharacterized protein n=1 Tax=Persea americana TaxID=3435 RepID=A0ACC2M5E8_PERAE|nr:hypothetical protein MRB53_017555 [Persea americana]
MLQRNLSLIRECASINDTPTKVLQAEVQPIRSGQGAPVGRRLNYIPCERFAKFGTEGVVALFQVPSPALLRAS